MRTILRAFFLLFISSAAFAQPYHPLLDSAVNRWTYTGNYLPVRLADQTQVVNCGYSTGMTMSTYRHYTGTDTVINSLTYKILYQDDMSTCLYGFIREDTTQRKVYFMDNNNSQEILLYDFSMIPGNTITISFINPNGFYNSGTYLLDSIRTKAVHHAIGMRRIFYLHCTSNPGPYYLEWIEGIGNFMHLVYPYSYNQPSAGWFGNCYPALQYQFYQFLTCFEHDGKEYYDSCAYVTATTNSCLYYQDTCDYWNICSAVDEHSLLSSFTLSPNPASDRVNVEINLASADETELLILDVTGRQVLQKIPFGKLPEGRQKRMIDVSALKDGFYLVQCKTGDGSMTRRLIIKH